jgi:HlyD family secretion protein
MKQVIRIGVAITLSAGALACDTGEAEEVGGIQTVTVERGSLRLTAEAVGSIEPVRRVEVKSKASGEILRLYVDVGDQVETGALLAEVDPRDVRNRYDQAAADLDVSEAQAANAQTQLERSEELHAAGIITDQELESSRLSFTNSQANLTRSRTNFDLARLQLEDVTIRAPMTGTILQKNVEEGTVIQSASGSVSGGTALFVMASLGEMQVRTLVDETDIGQLRPGLLTAVSVQSYPGRNFEGVVEQIEPQAVVQQNVTKFPVIISLDNSEGLLKPGMNGDVEVLIDEARDILLLDNSAIVMPQDAVPAALALGLDESAIENMAQAPAARPGMPEGAAENGEGPDPEALRQAMEARRAAGAGQARGGGQGRGGQVRGGAARAGGQGGARATTRAVVFVVDASGVVSPRAVQIGLSDWIRTQIVSGLEEGEQVALVGAAQLQAQQEAARGGPSLNPFGGGIPGGGGGRGRGF